MRGGKFQVRGSKKVEKKLARLSSKTSIKRVLRRAASAATTPLRKAVVAEAPVDTGAYKKSIARAVTMKGFIVDGRVGPRKNFRVGDRVPGLYSHLLEFGTQDMPAAAPLRRGYDKAKAEMQRTYAEKMRQGLMDEARKLSRR